MSAALTGSWPATVVLIDDDARIDHDSSICTKGTHGRRAVGEPAREGAATVVFVDADSPARLRDSSELEEGSEGAQALERSIGSAVLGHGGRLIPTLGHGAAASFDSSERAVACAFDLQRSLVGDGSTTPFRIRVGVYAGEADLSDERTALATAIARCSRICSLGHGGQTLLSRSTVESLGDRLPSGASLRDLGRQRLRDLAHTENVWQLCHPDLHQDEFPPLRSLDAVPNNLPMQATNFIGREREAAAVRRHLSSTRLLTITGAGGCGKTRLSFEAVVDLLDEFPDGVWWVDLASISDPLLVAKTVATAASIQEIPNQPILQTLGRSLHERRSLLMLDNCEHVIEACATLAQSLLSTTLSTALIATSREPLGVGGEITFRIPSLSFPPEHSSGTIDSLSQYEAVRLFIDRALRAHPDFRATNETAAAIAEICHRLDGIPLAIELAAARTRVLAPDQIAAGLGDVFRVLTGGARTAVPRQRTIEASIDWSHELLLLKERMLFRRLAVFAGGFDLAGAERVCPGDGIEEPEVLELLTGLVDKSLVQWDSEPRGSRFRLLETIRHYASRMLAASDELAPLRARHLEYMVAFSERAAPGLEGAAHQAWVDTIEPDLDNVRAALEWSIEQDDGDAALRIAGALWLYWESRGVSEGLAWIRSALARTSGDRRARATALHAGGMLSMTMGDPVSSLALAEEAVAISRETSDEKVLGRALMFAGMTRTFLGIPDGFPLVIESVELARKTGDPYSLGDALAGFGIGQVVAGLLPMARVTLEESVAASKQAGNPILLARAHLFLGWTRLHLTEVPAAREALEEASAIATAAQAGFWMNFSRILLAVVGLLEGSVDRARTEFPLAIADAGELASAFGMAFGLWGAAQAARAVGDIEAATPIVLQGSAIQRATGFRYMEAWSLAMLAELEASAGDLTSARTHIDQAKEVVREAPNAFAEGRVHLARASLAVATDDLAAAEDAIHEALRLFGESGHLQGIVDSIERLAELAALLESFEEAARLIGSAEAARAAIGYVRFAADRPGIEEVERGCRAALGDVEFEAAHAEGSRLSLEQGVAYASRGRGTRKRPSTGWASLTPAEVDVVRLVAEGLTNAAIGKQLFISPRTVQAHLARIFVRLGFGSRTELAAEAIKRGLTFE